MNINFMNFTEGKVKQQITHENLMSYKYVDGKLQCTYCMLNI